MDRLDIEYDFLPRESEILHLHFWDAAFIKLKESGVLTFESEGKNKGCWVMRRAGTANTLTTGDTENTEEIEIKTEDFRVDTYASQGTPNSAVRITHVPSGIVVTSESENTQEKNRQRGMMLLRSKLLETQTERISEEDQKVIVRSNGTVGYVGKDIAYHMWKFGLLGRDFGYRKFYRYPNNHDCWISPQTVKRIILTSATSPRSTTSSMRANPRRRTRSSKLCAGSVTARPPTTTHISPTRWLR